MKPARSNRIVQELKKEFPEVDTPNIQKVVELLENVNPDIVPSEDFKNALQSKITQEITKKKLASYAQNKKTPWVVIFGYMTGAVWVACFLFAFSVIWTNFSLDDAPRSTHLLTRPAGEWHIGGLVVNDTASGVQPLAMSTTDDMIWPDVWIFSREIYEPLISGLDIPTDEYVYKKHFVPSQMLSHVDSLQGTLFSDTMTSRMSIVSQDEIKNPIDIDFEMGNIQFSRFIDMSTMPEDTQWQKQFISTQLKNLIKLGWYGEPHDAEDQFYQKTSEKDVNVWYPFLMYGREVLNEYGQELGLSVFLSHSEQKMHVQGFIGRFPYETSVYNLAYETEDILTLIEKMYRQSAPGFTPKRAKLAYVVAKHPYSQDEYLLPSLVFTGEVWEKPFYVPLVPEMYE